MTSLNVTDSRITRINELQRIIAPIQMNIENLEENIYRFKELSNQKLVQYIKDTNTMGIDSNTILEFSMDEKYSNLRVTNKESNGSWKHGFEISLELQGFDKFSMLTDKDEKFDPANIQFSISGASCNPNLENVQSLDTEIIKAYFCLELKKFGQDNDNDTDTDNDTENFFSMYSAILGKFFTQLEEKYNIRKELYPYTNELSSINKEIEQEKKSIADGETLVQIANSIGQKLEHNSELYEQNKAKYRYKYGRSLERMFKIGWNASYITILKVSSKTVSIRVGEYENKRVPKETMIKQFPMLKVMENQNQTNNQNA